MGASGQTEPVEAESDCAPAAVRTWIAARALGRFRRAIKSLSERGRRLGTGSIELRELERRRGAVLVELSGKPPRLAGWEVVGRLEHRDGGPGRLSFAGPDLDRAAWSGAEPWCEHCGLLRRRTVTHLVRKGGGVVRQVGSSCLRDYTGHDLTRAVRQAELIRKCSALVLRSARSPRADASTHPPLEEFLALVVRVVRERQDGAFVPRSRSTQEEPASADLALDAWTGGQRPEADDLEGARTLIAWGFKHLGRQSGPSEYERRLLRLLERGGRLSRREAAVAGGLYLAEERWRGRVFLGPVGAMIKAQVEVQVVRAAGHNRFGEVTWHGMRDERGRWIAWFASGGRRLDDGGRYRLRGRVRRHGEWRGRPVTVLERCVAEPM